MTNIFYDLPHETQSRHLQQLAREALRHWNIDERADLELIKYRENAVFKVVDPADEQRYVIRVHRAGYHSDLELRSELQWMQALTSAGVLTPDMVLTVTAGLFQTVQFEKVPEPRQCDVQRWIEGQPLGSIEGDGTDDVASMLQNYRIVGALQAKLHSHSERWSMPEGFERHSWDVAGMFGATPFWGDFRELETLRGDQLETVLQAREKLIVTLADFGQTRDRYGLIHADFLPENLIVGEGGIRLIDFDDSGFGWYMFDLATSLFYHLGEAYFEDLKQSLIEGYRSERDLSDAHVDMLPAFLLARGITYLSWLHTRKETETAQTMGGAIIASVVAQANDYLLSP